MVENDHAVQCNRSYSWAPALGASAAGAGGAQRSLSAVGPGCGPGTGAPAVYAAAAPVGFPPKQRCPVGVQNGKRGRGRPSRAPLQLPGTQESLPTPLRPSRVLPTALRTTALVSTRSVSCMMNVSSARTRGHGPSPEAQVKGLFAILIGTGTTVTVLATILTMICKLRDTRTRYTRGSFSGKLFACK